MEKQYTKYGGVRFENNVSSEEINEFVKNLPASQKNSLHQIFSQLDKKGLITIFDGDNITVDKNMEEFMVPNNGDGQ